MINKELRKKIKELEPYLNSGKPAPANDIIDTYNLFHKPDPRTGRKVGYTSCGSCLRRYLTEMVDAIKKTVEKKSDNLSNGFSRSMLLLNEKDTEFAKMVERHFGVKCVLGGKKGISPLKEGRAPFFEEGEKGSWDNTFSGVSVTPCNAIIINDHYLKGDSGTKNLIDIIRNLSKQRAHDVTLHILVIYSGGKDGTNLNKYHKFFSEQAERTAYKLAKLDAEMNYLLEYVYCDDTNSLWNVSACK